MEIVTIAKPYANAVFAIAQQDKSHNDWKIVLEAAASLVEDSQMQAYLESPKVSKTDKSNSIQKLVSSIANRALSAKENEFLLLILANGRTAALPSVLALFEDKLNTFDAAKAFMVTSAFELTDAEEEAIISDLGAKYNAKVTIETMIDESLVGGLIIKLGDKVIDLSIKARSEELSLRLTTH